MLSLGVLAIVCQLGARVPVALWTPPLGATNLSQPTWSNADLLLCHLCRQCSTDVSAQTPALRPTTHPIPRYVDLMRSCWAHEPGARPTMDVVIARLLPMLRAELRRSSIAAAGSGTLGPPTPYASEELPTSQSVATEGGASARSSAVATGEAGSPAGQAAARPPPGPSATQVRRRASRRFGVPGGGLERGMHVISCGSNSGIPGQLVTRLQCYPGTGPPLPTC